jgi:DNA-binding LytR/AlgR family response regulator
MKQGLHLFQHPRRINIFGYPSATVTPELKPNLIMSKPLFVRQDGVLLRLTPDDIFWMEAKGNFTKLYFVNNTDIMIRCPLETAVGTLPDKQFAVVARSWAISIKYLVRVERDNVTLFVEEMRPYMKKDQEPVFTLPLTKVYVKGLMECLTVVEKAVVRKSRSRWRMHSQWLHIADLI